MGPVLETQACRTGDPALIVAVDAAATGEDLEDLSGGRAIEPDHAGKLSGLDRRPVAQQTFSPHLTSASAIWAEIAYEGIYGAGRVAPVVNVLLDMKTPAEGAEAEVHRLDLSLLFEGERVSRAELAPVRANPYAFTTTAAFPLSPRRLTFIGDRASGDVLSFKIEIVGLLRVRRTSEGASFTRPEIPVGEWAFVITDHAELSFIVPRSVRFSSVLSPISDSSFVTVEIEVPKGTDTAPFVAFWRTRRSPKLPPAAPR